MAGAWSNKNSIGFSIEPEDQPKQDLAAEKEIPQAIRIRSMSGLLWTEGKTTCGTFETQKKTPKIA